MLLNPVATDDPLDDFLAPPAWAKDALCAEPHYPREWWFPTRGESTKEAELVCAQCLVRDECLAFALSDQDAYLHGIWAGTSARERRRLRNLMRAA